MNENCTCPKTDFQTENVIELKPHPFLTELHNASFFNQIHKRTTHSREAFVALLCIGGLTSLVIVSVFLSKMWREKSTFAVQQKQPIQYTQHGPKDEILVRGNSIYDQDSLFTFSHTFYSLKDARSTYSRQLLKK